jgi:hypothetical protein
MKTLVISAGLRGRDLKAGLLEYRVRVLPTRLQHLLGVSYELHSPVTHDNR